MQKIFDDKQMSKNFYRQRNNKILKKLLQSAKAKSKKTKNELFYKQHEIDRNN